MDIILGLIIFFGFLFATEESPSQRRDRAARKRRNKNILGGTTNGIINSINYHME